MAYWLVHLTPDQADPVRERPVVPFLKAPETFPACKAIFSSSVPKNREVYMPETSCRKRTSV